MTDPRATKSRALHRSKEVVLKNIWSYVERFECMTVLEGWAYETQRIFTFFFPLVHSWKWVVNKGFCAAS